MIDIVLRSSGIRLHLMGHRRPGGEHVDSIVISKEDSSDAHDHWTILLIHGNEDDLERAHNLAMYRELWLHRAAKSPPKEPEEEYEGHSSED